MNPGADDTTGYRHDSAKGTRAAPAARRPSSAATARPAAREELAQNADSVYVQLMKQIVEDAAAVVLTIDLEGKILYANRAFLEAVSYSLDDLLGESITGMIRESDRDSVSDALARAVAGTSLRHVALLLRDRWGESLELLVSIRLLSGERGDPIALSAVGIDVTLMRKAETNAAAQDELIAEIERGANVLIAPFDGNGNTVEWGASCESATGISRAAAIGRPLAEICAAGAPDGSRESLRKQIHALLRGATRGVRYDASRRHDAGDREAASVEWWLAPTRGAGGVITGGIAIGRDASSARRAEQETRAARETLAALLDADGDAVFITDRHGAVAHWNEAMARLTGIAPADITGGRAEHRLPWLAQSAYVTALGDLLEGTLASYESPPRPIETPAGRRSVVVRANSLAAGAGCGRGVVVRVQDVTETLHVRGELAMASACHQRVLELTNDHVYTLDAMGRITDINPAARAFAGSSRAPAALGARFEEVVAPASRPAVLASWERAQCGMVVPFAYVQPRERGETRFSASICALSDAGGRPQRYVVVSRPESEVER